jgi:transposase
MPYANTECLNVFFKLMSEQYSGQEIIIILDGAGWHKSKALEVPKNITLVFLPPYTPELNPVERLWNYLKSHTLKNRIYDNINTLEIAVCDFIKTFSSDILKSICSANYLLN